MVMKGVAPLAIQRTAMLSVCGSEPGGGGDEPAGHELLDRAR